MRMPDRRLFLFAGGTHTAASFGRTLDSLPRADNLSIIPVPHHLDGDGPTDVAASVGRATEGFSLAFAEHRPDLLFVLGDRTEMLAAAHTATIHRIPLAHIHGGESTAGAYDDACRHAITKLSHVHFVVLPEYGERVRAMNEEAWRVHTVGAPALDRLRDFEPESVIELSIAIDLDLSRPTIVVIFHPETLATIPPGGQIAALLHSLESFAVNMLFLGSNSDVGHESIRSAMAAFVGQRPDRRLIPSLPPRRFWSCLAHAAALVGNSSAGIIEAASFGLPVVNIGDRQKGRVRPGNVIDIGFDEGAIRGAIERALSTEFTAKAAIVENPYGDQRAAGRIADVMEKLPPATDLLRKLDAKKPP